MMAIYEEMRATGSLMEKPPRKSYFRGAEPSVPSPVTVRAIGGWWKHDGGWMGAGVSSHEDKSAHSL